MRTLAEAEKAGTSFAASLGANQDALKTLRAKPAEEILKASAEQGARPPVDGWFLPQDVYTIFADYTVLATGGLGQIYLHTTNTRSSIGDGVVMANRAGARIMNAEYVQFHPTALADKKANHFLISEALRGEGARLRNHQGEYFMEKYSPQQFLVSFVEGRLHLRHRERAASRRRPCLSCPHHFFDAQ